MQANIFDRDVLKPKLDDISACLFLLRFVLIVIRGVIYIVCLLPSIDSSSSHVYSGIDLFVKKFFGSCTLIFFMMQLFYNDD
jgi:hypothetical protein